MTRIFKQQQNKIIFLLIVILWFGLCLLTPIISFAADGSSGDGWWDYVSPTTPTTPTTPSNPTGEGQWVWGVWVPANGSCANDSGDDGSGDDGSGSGHWVNFGGQQVWVPDRNSGDDGSGDDDMDGFTGSQGDCDDTNPDIYPGAEEICGDGIDQDCDGSDVACGTDSNDVDNDGDGYTENQGDCQDWNERINPGAEEICGDGIDQDCDGSDLACAPDPNDIDNDGDGYTKNQGDCHDWNNTIYPGAEEICGDGIDQDCDGSDLACAPDDGNTPPDAPLALSPNANMITSLTPKLETYEFLDIDGDTHVKTRWLIGKSQTDESLMVIDEITDKQLTAWQVPSVCILEKDTLYYWRAMFFDGQDWSVSSNINSFRTGGAGIGFDVNGIGMDSVIEPGETVTLGSEFMDGDGNLILSDTRKAMKSVVDADIQIGMTVDSDCMINKICSRRPEDCIAHDAGAAIEIPDMPYGVIDFAVTVPEKGGSATVEFTFSEPLPENFQWWKYDPKEGGFYDFMDKPLLVSADGVLFSSDRKKLTLTLTDGGPGDLIETPDGKIIDLSGFGPAGATTAPKTSSGGGGGGCFIRSLIF